MTKIDLLVSWLNLYFQSETHKFLLDRYGEFFIRLTGLQSNADILVPKERILTMLQQIKPKFSNKMRPKLQAFIKELEVQIAKPTR